MSLGHEAGLKPADKLRNYFGKALLEVCQVNPKVVVLDGDLGNSTMTHYVRQEFPERFFNLGIAESNLVSVGGGFAASGYIPFITSFPSFLLCNAYDQIRLSIAVAGLNAKLAGSHAGLTCAREGPSPMSIEDYALVGGLPTFVILVPSDPVTMRRAVFAATEHIGPVYLRSSREALPYIYGEDDCPFEVGKAIQVRPGGDVTLIACGLMVSVALDAAVLMAREGIQARVLDMYTLRPVDEDAIVTAAKETGAIVTLEEHLQRGGLGSLVAQVTARHHPVPMRFIGVNDTYPGSGSLDELMEAYGMTAAHAVEATHEVLKLMRSRS
jgi:transketolase